MSDLPIFALEDNPRINLQRELLAFYTKCIAEEGWVGIGVGADPDGSTPPFSYTIGFSNFGFPELIIFGAPNDVAHSAF